MISQLLKYIFPACWCVVMVPPSYTAEGTSAIELSYTIDYETFGLFHVNSTISLKHNLTNYSDEIVRLRISDTLLPVYTFQKTDGTQLQYHNTLSIPSSLFDADAFIAENTKNDDDGIVVQSETQIIELASENSYSFIDRLNLKEVEGLTSGSYYLTATVTVRHGDGSSAFFHTAQSGQIRLDIRNESTIHNTPIPLRSTDTIIEFADTVVDETTLSGNQDATGGFFDDVSTSYPHSVVDNMLTALVATDIKQFYGYFDIERLYRLDASNNQRYIQANEIERELLLEQFLRRLYDRPTFINSLLVPVQFNIHNTTYNRSNARVDVSMLFNHNGQELTTTTSILLELHDGVWVAIDYIALPER